MIQSKAKYWNGRKIAKEVMIERGIVGRDAAYVAYYKAKEYLSMSGMDYGSMDGQNPVGFIEGKYTIPQKWHNYRGDKSAIAKLSGVMIPVSDFRKGDVKIIFFEP